MLAAMCCATVVACAGRTGTTGGADPLPPVRVQVLAINDFHGHLEPPTGLAGIVGDVPAGGAAYLASQLARLRALNPNTVLVSAGDLIGGSPLLSALFHDEPTIEAMNLIVQARAAHPPFPASSLGAAAAMTPARAEERPFASLFDFARRVDLTHCLGNRHGTYIVADADPPQLGRPG